MPEVRDYDSQLFALLLEMQDAPELYAPTTFWGPGVRSLLSDYFKLGLPEFKRWPSSHSWFYSVYGQGFKRREIEDLSAYSKQNLNPRTVGARMNASLNGSHEARRDFDVARAAWDQSRWPMDFSFGESSVGHSPQAFHLSGPNGPVFGRPFLNYLLLLATLSRHVDEPPRRIVEIGGGFGAVGEILLKSDPGASYVDIDLPPLCVVSKYYLDHAVPEGDVTVVPPWKIDTIEGPADAFINAYSFQEMEPDVVLNYISHIARIGPKFVVSLNSIKGKKKRDESRADSIGVTVPVVSDFISSAFEEHGYTVRGRYQDPLFRSAAESVVLERT